MTLQQAIKKYNLIKQEKCFDGAKLPNGYKLYTSENHTEKVQAFYKGTNKETTKTYILED